MSNPYAERLVLKRLGPPLPKKDGEGNGEKVNAGGEKASYFLSKEPYVLPTPMEEYVGSNWELLAAGDTGVCGITVAYSGDTPHYSLHVIPITNLTREPVPTTWWEGAHRTPLSKEEPTTLALSPDGRLLAVAMRAGSGGCILLFYLDDQAHRLTEIRVDHPVEWLRWSKHATPDSLPQLLAVCRHEALLITSEPRTKNSAMSWVKRGLREFEEGCWGADWSPSDGRIAFSLLGKVAGGKDLDELEEGETVDRLMESAGRVMVVDSVSNAELCSLRLEGEASSSAKLEDCSFTRLDWLEPTLLLGVTVYGQVAFCQLADGGRTGAFKLTKVAGDYFGEYLTLGVGEGRMGGFRRVYVAHLPAPLDMLVLAASDQPRRMLAIDVKKMKHDVFGPGASHPDADNDLHGYCAYLMKDGGTDGLENAVACSDDEEPRDMSEAVQGLGVLCVRSKLPEGAGDCPLLLALGAGGTLFSMSVSDKDRAEAALMHDAPSLDGPKPAWLGKQEAEATASGGASAEPPALPTPPPLVPAPSSAAFPPMATKAPSPPAAFPPMATKAPSSSSAAFPPMASKAPSSTAAFPPMATQAPSASALPLTASRDLVVGAGFRSSGGGVGTFPGPQAASAPGPLARTAQGTGFGSTAVGFSSTGFGGSTGFGARTGFSGASDSLSAPTSFTITSSSSSSSLALTAPSGALTRQGAFGTPSIPALPPPAPAPAPAPLRALLAPPAPAPKPASSTSTPLPSRPAAPPAPPPVPRPSPGPPASQALGERQSMLPTDQRWQKLLDMADGKDSAPQLTRTDLSLCETEIRHVADLVQGLLDDVILYQDEVERVERDVLKLSERHVSVGRQVRDYTSILHEVSRDEPKSPTHRRRVNYPEVASAGTPSWQALSDELEEVDRLLGRMEMMDQGRQKGLSSPVVTPRKAESRKERMTRQFTRPAAPPSLLSAADEGQRLRAQASQLRALEKEMALLHQELRTLEKEHRARGAADAYAEEAAALGSGKGQQAFQQVDEDIDFDHPRGHGWQRAPPLKERVDLLRSLSALLEDAEGVGERLVVSNHDMRNRLLLETQKRQAAKAAKQDRAVQRPPVQSLAPSQPPPAPRPSTTSAKPSPAPPAPAAQPPSSSSSQGGFTAGPKPPSSFSSLNAAPAPGPPPSSSGFSSSSFSLGGGTSAPSFPSSSSTLSTGFGAKSGSAFNASAKQTTPAPSDAPQAKPSQAPPFTGGSLLKPSTSSSASSLLSAVTLGASSTSAPAPASSFSSSSSSFPTATTSVFSFNPPAPAPATAPAPAPSKPSSSAGSAAFPPMPSRAPSAFNPSASGSGGTGSTGVARGSSGNESGPALTKPKPSSSAAPMPPMPSMAPRKASDILAGGGSSSQAQAKSTPTAPPLGGAPSSSSSSTTPSTSTSTFTLSSPTPSPSTPTATRDPFAASAQAPPSFGSSLLGSTTAPAAGSTQGSSTTTTSAFGSFGSMSLSSKPNPTLATSAAPAPAPLAFGGSSTTAPAPSPFGASTTSAFGTSTTTPTTPSAFGTAAPATSGFGGGGTSGGFGSASGGGAFGTQAPAQQQQQSGTLNLGNLSGPSGGPSAFSSPAPSLAPQSSGFGQQSSGGFGGASGGGGGGGSFNGVPFAQIRSLNDAERLRLFYTKYEPSKAAKVDQLVGKYAGRYPQMWATLFTKYPGVGAAPQEEKEAWNGGPISPEQQQLIGKLLAQPQGQQQQVSPMGGGFAGQATSTNTGYAFGQKAGATMASPSGFGAGGGGFGASTVTPPMPGGVGSGFSSFAKQASPFGAATGGSGFGQQASTGAFGSGAAGGFGGATSGGFGATAQPSGFGGQPSAFGAPQPTAFGGQQQQQQQQASGFGGSAAPGGFGGGGFGTPQQGSGFGASQNTAFGTPQQPTQGAFGASSFGTPSQPTQPQGGMFTPPQQPSFGGQNSGFGGFNR